MVVEDESGTKVERWIPLVALCVGVVAWLWPIGVGGQMPVGGDVTQFSLGLMGFLGRVLRDGRIPFWNDLWGYGFPGLGESQMGVFYPPHLLLYGLLSTELAYTASLVAHTLLGALGAYWLGRGLGFSGKGAAFAGFSWIASGFFVIHLPHQWGYTTSAWLPWAIGLTWKVVMSDRPGRFAILLSAVLATQLLPGHFQIGFITEVSVLVVFAAGLVSRLWNREPIGRRFAFGTLALIGALPLASVQLGPTADLARLAASMRDWEYLAGFAASPFHLVSYLAPGLFRRSPLWRSLAWDSFHTSPEEYLGYVGIVALFLALFAVGRGWRADRRVLVILSLVLVSLFLSMGPYVPGSSLLFRLPGFSFFRAPARWSIATGLGLSMLAGMGLDGWKTVRHSGRWLVGFVAGSFLVLAGYVLVIDGAFVASEVRGSQSLRSVYEQAFRRMPWSGDPDFLTRMQETRQPWNDFRAAAALARQGVSKPTADQLTLSKQRTAILVQELAPTAVMLVVLLGIAGLARWTRGSEMLLIGVAVVDLLLLVQLQRPTDLSPIGPLSARSTVLASLSGTGEAGRLVDASRNLPMLVGAAPVSGYRTLDLPVALELTALTREPLGQAHTEGLIGQALRVTGVKTRILDPFEVQQARRRPPGLEGWLPPVATKDRALASWLFGSAWVESNLPLSEEFATLTSKEEATIAWLVRGNVDESKSAAISAQAILARMRDATPLKASRDRPEQLIVEVPAGSTGTVVITQLAHPGWTASWDGARGSGERVIRSVFGGWQAITLTEPGEGKLHLHYHERTFVPCLVISGLSWLIWAGLLLFSGRAARRSSGQ